MLCTDREIGNKANLAEIQQAKEDDPSFQNLTKEERKEAIDQLILYQQEKTLNPQATNKGAARNVFLVMNMIEKEVWKPVSTWLKSAM